MGRLAPLRGTWIGVMAMLLPVLFVTVASATPWEAPDPAPAADGDLVSSLATTTAPPTADRSATTQPATAPDSAGDTDGDPAADDLNHGQIVRNAGDLTEDVEGCVGRQVAQSDLGKPNADPDADGPTLLEDGSIDPDSVDLDCSNGTATADDEERGKPENPSDGRAADPKADEDDSNPAKDKPSKDAPPAGKP
jgi:hypothetical protein